MAHATDAPALLQARGVDKIFPGVRALDGVDFALRPGEIHALLGENGAGKSTLIKVITGVLRRDGGDLFLNGREIDPHAPAESERLGIAAVHQEAPARSTSAWLRTSSSGASRPASVLCGAER
ncbi:ATP-binding cassette domain-containing protein [Brevundimonas abyssalis]|uniref:Putative sugar ABC transport system, ATP-binding protein YtfR n=1 Tax=Brevundimonas abyssalis TAR-001 TaxID=1391729 RepID=A0A8E0KJ90_9CAUL|nr:ATP-binding cassette domain-containing protein [Brevundimonas abyssalis]GAD58751.1 putative sugar ABC transport system, ATP-binding protein YtfR [Brevundimonas abyssalis TAR-001]